MDGSNAPSKIDLRFAESKVIFLICECSLDKKLSFYSLNREEATRFIKRLKHIEKMTWGQFAAVDRKVGITSENPNTESFEMVHSHNTSRMSFGAEVLCRLSFFTKSEFELRQAFFQLIGGQGNMFFCYAFFDK